MIYFPFLKVLVQQYQMTLPSLPTLTTLSPTSGLKKSLLTPPHNPQWNMEPLHLQRNPTRHALI